MVSERSLLVPSAIPSFDGARVVSERNLNYLYMLFLILILTLVLSYTFMLI